MYGGVACDKLLMKMVSNMVYVFLLLEYTWALIITSWVSGNQIICSSSLSIIY